MKPAIPDTGTVIRLDGERAVIRLRHEGSCKGCGAAAMGLCKGGLMQELTVGNPTAARVGDRVKIGLVRHVQYKGYILAYVVPAVALIAGMVAGHFLGALLGVPALDILTGFASLVAVSWQSLRQLKRLDASHSIEIVSVYSDPWIPGSSGPADGSLSSHGSSSCFPESAQHSV